MLLQLDTKHIGNKTTEIDNLRITRYNQVPLDSHIKDQISLVLKAIAKLCRNLLWPIRILDRETQEHSHNLMLWATMQELISQERVTSTMLVLLEKRINGRVMYSPVLKMKDSLERTLNHKVLEELGSMEM